MRRWDAVDPAKVQQLVDAVDLAEQHTRDAWDERCAAVRALYGAVGATEAARLLGLSRQSIYQLAGQAAS